MKFKTPDGTIYETENPVLIEDYKTKFEVVKEEPKKKK